MPVYYLANKSGYSFVQLYLLLYKNFALIDEFIYNCHFRLATQGTIYYIPGFLQIATMLLNAIIKESNPSFPNTSIYFYNRSTLDENSA